MQIQTVESAGFWRAFDWLKEGFHLEVHKSGAVLLLNGYQLNGSNLFEKFSFGGKGDLLGEKRCQQPGNWSNCYGYYSYFVLKLVASLLLTMPTKIQIAMPTSHNDDDGE